MPGRIAINACLALALLVAWSTQGLAASAETSCDVAAARAERDWNIPSGVLSAVGSVESGRKGRTGLAPWPWTINAAGRGTFHDNKGDAVATVLAIMLRGFPYIDVGCFQVDIAYHAGVFRSLDEAFDPEKNAQAAAMILLTERSRSPDWDTAIARYHSATPGIGSAYLARVRSALPSAKLRALTAQAEAEAVASDIGPKLPSERRPLPVVIYGFTSPNQAIASRGIAGRSVRPSSQLSSQVLGVLAQPKEP